MTSNLRWAQTLGVGAVWALSGDLRVALIVEPSVDNPDHKWVWQMEVPCHYICQAHGEVATQATAKRAVERAWTKWLRNAALKPQ